MSEGQIGTPHALANYLAQLPANAFDWAQWHCGHYIGGWVLQARGRDVLATLPACTTALAWARALHRAGGWQELVSRCLGCQPVAPAFAQIGDVVLMPGAVTGGALGLCAGHTVACLGDDGASLHLPLADALAAWRLHEVAP